MLAWGTTPKKLRGAALAASGVESDVAATTAATAIAAKTLAIDAFLFLMLISSAEPWAGSEVAVDARGPGRRGATLRLTIDGTVSVPSRAPVVCGAIGDYDRRLLLGAATAECRPVHEDSRSILLLDREPMRWRGRGRSGLAWVEGGFWRGSVASWEQASRQGACGLVLAGRRRHLHSSVSGVGPLYWLDREGATYFASRIELLLELAPGPLSVDWDAWSSILALRYPLGERTPFAEIRRLGPSSTLRRRRGRSQARAHRWPWSEVEPGADLAAGAATAAEALREALRPLDGEVLCPLSGGQDSRLLLATLCSLGAAKPRALTVGDDEGGRFEQDLAAPVARSLRVPQEELPAALDAYPADWRERAARVEHQFVDHAWLMPLARRLDGAGAWALDGFALDALQMTGAGFFQASAEAPDPRSATNALFDSLRMYGHAEQALEPRLGATLVERARAQFAAAASPLEGHPSQTVLSLYATRTVRGISTCPHGLLGRNAAVLAPGCDDAVVRGLLSVPQAEKGGTAMHAAIQEHVAPQLAGLPSTTDAVREPPSLPRRWRSPSALDMHRRLLEDGPLTPHLAPQLLAWLREPRGELSAHLRLGMESVSLFHHWCGHHRRRLREIDPAGLRT